MQAEGPGLATGWSSSPLAAGGSLGGGSSAATMLVAASPSKEPSFLEVCAATNLQKAIQSAFAHAVQALADPESREPGRARDLASAARRFKHEIALAAAVALQLASLDSDGATVGEALYALRRVGLGSALLPAALAHCVVPYVENALGDAHAAFADLRASGLPLEEVFPGPGSRAVVHAVTLGWPVLRAALGLADLAQRLLHMGRFSASPTLEHRALRQSLTKVTSPAEWNLTRRIRDGRRAREVERARRKWAGAWGGSGWVVALLKCRHAAADHSKVGLVGLVVGFKILEWWFTKAEDAIKLAGKPLPPPPPPTPHPEGCRLPRSPHLCPLCRKQRTAPAALTVTGYVFCYACILPYVREHGRCPVTRVRAKEHNVRRLAALGDGGAGRG